MENYKMAEKMSNVHSDIRGPLFVESNENAGGRYPGAETQYGKIRPLLALGFRKALKTL